MNNFSNQWMQDICQELNKANIPMPTSKGGGKWSVEKFENSIELLKMGITLDAGIYNYLNSKGLINRGYCPITGEAIGTQHLYQIFERKVYLSEEGKKQAKEWDRQQYVKDFGKEPPTEQERQEALRKIQEGMPSPLSRIIVWIFVIVLILYLIKKC